MSYINWLDVRKKIYDFVAQQEGEVTAEKIDVLENEIKGIVSKAYKKSKKNPKKDMLTEEDLLNVLEGLK
ncbi:MAG: hypothetical protein PHW96_01300 [Candidatus Nanoarchaeia archaeon]|nr:hypothetical protein [Candidatus Nanoarchaeia archaeon]